MNNNAVPVGVFNPAPAVNPPAVAPQAPGVQVELPQIAQAAAELAENLAQQASPFTPPEQIVPALPGAIEAQEGLDPVAVNLLGAFNAAHSSPPAIPTPDSAETVPYWHSPSISDGAG